MPGFARVSEVEADGKVKSTFEEIKATLGVSVVGDLFEQLGVFPSYLRLAWRNLKPNAQTAYFHRMSAELEDMALRGAGRSRHRAGIDVPNLSPAEARLDLDAKLLAATASLRYGTNGQLPKMLWLSADDKRVVSPSTSETLPQDEPEPAAESRDARELRQHAALTAESLPYRMEISATALRQSGVTEDDIDSLRAILNSAWDHLPRRLLAGAALTASGARSTSAEPEAA